MNLSSNSNSSPEHETLIVEEDHGPNDLNLLLQASQPANKSNDVMMEELVRETQ
jgi:hypothetical protein